MSRGKTVKLFLMDGTATGCIKCTMANWTGIVYKIPRCALEKCSDIHYLQQSGICFLFNTNTQNERTVYISQTYERMNGKDLLHRLRECTRKTEWEEAIVLTTINDSLDMTEINYIVNRFSITANESAQYQLLSKSEPNHDTITEETECELEEFIDNAETVMSVLGYRLTETSMTAVHNIDRNAADNAETNETGNSDIEGPLLHMRYKNVKATGRCTSNGFVLMAGSTINPETTKNFLERVAKTREKYADQIDDNYKLKSDILLTTPSAAADFVSGASLHGTDHWKDSDGRTLREIKRSVNNI